MKRLLIFNKIKETKMDFKHIWYWQQILSHLTSNVTTQETDRQNMWTPWQYFDIRWFVPRRNCIVVHVSITKLLALLLSAIILLEAILSLFFPFLFCFSVCWVSFILFPFFYLLLHFIFYYIFLIVANPNPRWYFFLLKKIETTKFTF